MPLSISAKLKSRVVGSKSTISVAPNTSLLALAAQKMIEEIQVDTGKTVTSMSSVNDQVDSGVVLANQALDAMDGIVQSSEESM